MGMETRMEWQKPSLEEVWRAVDVYLDVAYAKSAPPTTVKSRVDELRGASLSAFYDSSSLERDCVEGPPQKFSLRLGNHFYPHMKLVIEAAPGAGGHIFRADTHDKHIRPSPQSSEYQMFRQLMEKNQRLSEAIESEWERAGLPTFKQFLRDDLARRAAADSRVL
jgi:hypothetical protein